MESESKVIPFRDKSKIRDNLKLRFLDYIPFFIGARNFGMRTIEDGAYYNSGQEMEHAMKGVVFLAWGVVSTGGVVYGIWKGIELLSQ